MDCTVAALISSHASNSVVDCLFCWFRRWQNLKLIPLVQQTNGSDGQVVQPGDPRLGLIGQRAVRVKERNFAPVAENSAALTEADTEAEASASAAASAAASVIPSGSVLLHYAGTLRTETEFNDRYDFQQR